jgi:hypothetical protein
MSSMWSETDLVRYDAIHGAELLQRPYDQVEQPEANRDAWSEAWGDPALQNLGRRLVAYGVGAEQAATVVEQTWLFYSYEALPLLGERFPMGIAARAGSPPHVWLYLPVHAADVPLAAAKTNPLFLKLNRIFIRKVEEPLSDQVVMDLESVGMHVGPGLMTRSTLHRFEVRAHEIATRRRSEFLGIFVDDLIAELKTVMNPDDAASWLETPNSVFGGRRPIEFVEDPGNQQLRDVITRAKFNLSAA